VIIGSTGTLDCMANSGPVVITTYQDSNSTGCSSGNQPAACIEEPRRRLPRIGRKWSPRPDFQEPRVGERAGFEASPASLRAQLEDGG
jgi:hypothetical protein